jgi:3-hydroxyisobutyrate dehydrogenase
MAQIAFAGIGRMGWPMAARLVAAGHALRVLDAAPGRAAQFAARHGGTAAPDPAAAAEGAAVVITMLPSSREVEEVLGAMRPALARGTVVVEMSSGEPSATQRLARELSALGVAMVDAPVSGGVARAEDGTLSIMAGGEEGALAQVEPVLRAMGSTVTRCGDVGAGQAMKALNNLVSAAGFLVGVEALLVGQRFGLDPATMVEVLNASTGRNNSTDRKFAQFVLSRGFDSGFGLDLMVKDLSIALQVARETGTAAPLSALCREMWAAAAATLGPGQDHTALARFSEGLAGVELASPRVPQRG